MDNEKIKELARQYAEDVFGEGDYPFKEDDMSNAEDDFESVVAFLSKTHCIVEKNRIKEIYNRKTIPSMEDIHNKMIEECLIEALFGKELFNGTEK